jgi:WD40 repeat protein
MADVGALAKCEGRICTGSFDGSIRVWGGTSLEHERTLRDEEDADDGVRSLAVWEWHLISGHASGAIRVWNVATGACDRKLQGHSRAVRFLAVSGARLVSGSGMSLKVWAMGAGETWPCWRKLVGHTDLVASLATW